MKGCRNGLNIFILGAFLFFTKQGVAQQPITEKNVETSQKVEKAEKDKKKTSIDFEDELIQGELKKPELFYLLQKKQFNFKRLIKLREDFLPEMRRTSEDLRKVKGGK